MAALGHSWPGQLWATGTYDPQTGGETAAKHLHPVEDASKNWFTQRMRRFYRDMWAKRETTGTSGDFKVQLYDVETESNGLLSYDRALWKVDPAVVARGARGERLAEATAELIPCAASRPTAWRFTTEQPAEKWFAADFDDTPWKQGEPGFGAGLPGVRTPWTNADIWLRKEFTLTAKPHSPLLRIFHDEGVEVYLNGVLACRDGDFLTAYDDFQITGEAAATLHPGKNVIAVHCHQTTGGQYIDVGLLEVQPETKCPPR